jgi:hypothetical protein
MSTQDDFSPERIADRMRIQHVMHRWCRAVDRLDYDGIRAVFHPDAIDTHGAYNGGVEGLVGWIRERHSNIPFSMHAVSNMLIEFAGPDLALAETYVRTTQRYPAEAREKLDQLAGGKAGAGEGGMDLMTCSRYVDRFERRGGEWRIAARTLVADWKQFVPVPADLPKPPAGWVTGRRDQEDFVFRERRALGIR